jgi:mRNA interferase MazF
VRRGDVCWYTFQPPDKKRPVLVLTRDSAIPVLNTVTIAPITSTVRSIPTQILLTAEDGLPDTCAASFANIQTVSRARLGTRLCHLSAKRMHEAEVALAFALGFDTE